MILNDYLQEIIAGDSEIRSVFEWGSTLRHRGKDPIDLSIGNPDIKPPKEYYSALEQIINESKISNINRHGYMPNSGYPGTRKRIASDLSQFLNVNFNAEQLFMTVGAANGIDIVLKTLIQPIMHKSSFTGETPFSRTIIPDEIISIAPYFVEYKNYINSNQGKQIVVFSDNNFDLNLDRIEKKITCNTRAIILNSPNNPTGALYGEETLRHLSELLIKTWK